MKPIYQKIFPKLEPTSRILRISSTTNFIDNNRFPIKYSKTVNKLKERSISIDESICKIREKYNKSFAGTFLQYLFEICLIKKYELNYSDISINVCKPTSNFAFNIFVEEISEKRFNKSLDKLSKNDLQSDELIMHAVYRSSKAISKFSSNLVIKPEIIDDEDIKIIINYFMDELIPQLEIKGIIYFDDSSYLSIYENNLLICEPDFIIDGKIIDFKVCEKNNYSEWARQLFIYSEGLVQNKIIPHGMYVLNLFTNELIKFEID